MLILHSTDSFRGSFILPTHGEIVNARLFGKLKGNKEQIPDWELPSHFDIDKENSLEAHWENGIILTEEELDDVIYIEDYDIFVSIRGYLTDELLDKGKFESELLT